MPRQFNTDDLRKALDQYADYENDNPYDADDAREALVERALDNNLLNEFIENEIRQNREYDDYDNYDPDEYIGQDEIDNYARRLDASDFPEGVPYSDNISIDPDLEVLNVYNFVNDNPKAREFFTDQSVDFDREEGGNRFLRSLRAGSFTPEQLRTLRNIRYAGDSSTLEEVADDRTAFEAADFVNRAAAGRDVAPLEPIYQNTADTLNRLQNLASVERGLREYSEDLRNVSQRLQRYQGGDLPYVRQAETPAPGVNVFQTSLPLDDDPTQGRLASISSDLRSLPTSINTVTELSDARNRLNSIQRDLGGVASLRSDPSERARDFIRQSVLPQVESALGSQGADQAARNAFRNILNDRREAADNARREASDRARLAALEGRRPRREPVATAMPTLERNLEGTNPIPGLNEQFQRGRVEEFKRVVSQFPEVERLLATPLKSSARPPLRGDASKTYMPYVDTQQVISMPEDRVRVYESLLADESISADDPQRGANLVNDVETLYTSGDPALQRQAFQTLDAFGYGDQLRDVSSPATYATRPIVGGGGYVGGVGGLRDTNESRELGDRIKTRAESLAAALRGNEDIIRAAYPNYFDRPSVQRKLEVVYDPDTKTVRPAEFGDTNVYGISVSTGNPRLNPIEAVDAFGDRTMSSNALKFFADNPILGTTSVAFTTRTPSEGYSYNPKELPSAVSDELGRFAQRTALQGLPPGTLVSNSPLESTDLLQSKRREGLTPETSSTLRKLESFKQAGQDLPNLRAAAYTTAGFGPYSQGSQYAYIDAKGRAVPIQMGRSAPGFSDKILVNPYDNSLVVKQGRLPLTTKAYYSVDPVVAAAQGLTELGRGIKRTPAALLPGAADLIPSPEAIQTGYREGVLPMARQMGTEFVGSLPVAAATAGALATPIAAPFAPGIGAGMVGVAGTRALNEVVRQQTGEGIVPKLRQAFGTAPRSGVASPSRVGPAITPQIRPLNQAQRNEAQRRQNRNEVQKRMDLARERFNPLRGEFGLSELLFGR
jgi:hypothetical protein